jgi:hypothetical protein
LKIRRRVAKHKKFNLSYINKCPQLVRQAQPKRQSTTSQREAAVLSPDAIKANPGIFDTPRLRTALTETIASNPDSVLMAIGLNIPQRKARKRTYFKIMTAPTQEEKPQGSHPKKPIGFADEVQPENINPISV